MTAISPTTRAIIKAYLEVFIEKPVDEYRGRAMPNIGNPATYLTQQSAMIPPEILRINEFEHEFRSSLGTTYEECARLIALEHHDEAYRGYDLTGEVSLATINEIEHQLSIFEHTANNMDNKPSFEEMIPCVLDARREYDLVERSVRADLYLRARDETQFFFEIKSPMPNKGQCLEVTQRLLRFHLLGGQSRPASTGLLCYGIQPVWADAC